MSLRAGRYTFSHVTYDPPSDVLYAAIGRPRPGRREETPESHFLRFDGKDFSFDDRPFVIMIDSAYVGLGRAR